MYVRRACNTKRRKFPLHLSVCYNMMRKHECPPQSKSKSVHIKLLSYITFGHIDDDSGSADDDDHCYTIILLAIVSFLFQLQFNLVVRALYIVFP